LIGWKYNYSVKQMCIIKKKWKKIL
jgi:hypothetical protein